jgi:hypothetical protein
MKACWAVLLLLIVILTVYSKFCTFSVLCFVVLRSERNLTRRRTSECRGNLSVAFLLRAQNVNNVPLEPLGNILETQIGTLTIYDKNLLYRFLLHRYV